jgi:Na+-driven multidrug efflux pump
MDIIFIFGLGWGVAGAALATSFSQYVGVAAMLVLLHRRRILDFADLRNVPSLSDIAPLLWVSEPVPPRGLHDYLLHAMQ